MPRGQTILGIDLRVASVKVAEVEKRKEGFKIIKWGMTEVPYQLLDKHPQLEEAKADALSKILQTNHISSREAVVVVGGEEATVKLFTLSEMPRGDAAQAIKWKFAEEIPFPIDEAIIDFYNLPKSELSEKVDYVCAAISRNLYLQTRYIIEKAGLKLIGIVVLPDALLELFKKEATTNHDKVVSIIYMGKRTTNISIFRNGNFEFNRELNIGGENITLAMAGILVSAEGKIEITPEEAEKLKIEYGVPVDLETYPKLVEIPLNQLQAMVRPALEKIESEIVRTFEYYKGQTGEAGINKIILTGGASQTQHLPEFLQQGLGIPIIIPKPFPDFDQRMAGAVGAALVETQKINLLPEEIKYRWRMTLSKILKPQILISSFIGLLTLVYIYFWTQAFTLSSEVNSINRKLEIYKPRLARLEAIEKAAKEEEKKKLALAGYEEKKSKLPKVFEEISRIIPDNIKINVFNMTPTTLHFWGTVFEKEETPENTLSRFVLKLSNSPLFKKVVLIQAVKNEEYTRDALNFEITINLEEGK